MAGGSTDLLSVFLDDDRLLSEVRQSVERLDSTLERIRPSFWMGVCALVEIAGDLLESAGE